MNTVFLRQFFSYPKTLKNHFQTLSKFYVPGHLACDTVFLKKKHFVTVYYMLGLFLRAFCMSAHFILSHPGSEVLCIPMLSGGLTTRMTQCVGGEHALGRCLLGSPAQQGRHWLPLGPWPSAVPYAPLPCSLSPSELLLIWQYRTVLLFCGAMTGLALGVPATSCPSSSVWQQIWVIELGEL